MAMAVHFVSSQKDSTELYGATPLKRKACVEDAPKKWMLQLDRHSGLNAQCESTEESFRSRGLPLEVSATYSLKQNGKG